ncbi:hypothetical protein KY363_05905 [Candidatus Woesearchaeota archaeon]|nr:hypothetical protein [Candidatus Woesearchaeota archaeon]
MEQRKIIEFGKSSHVVSLPKDWLTARKLGKGDVVYVTQEGPKLIIFPGNLKETKKPRTVTIDVTDMTKYEIRQHLVSKYIRNFNEITLTAQNMKSKAKEVRAIVHDLMALEVVEEDSSRIVTRDFLNMDDITPMSLLVKMDNITRDMVSDSKNFFKEDKYQTIADRDTDVNRLSYLVFRSLKYLQRNPQSARQMGLSHDEFIMMWIAATKVEKIADQAKWITKLLRRVKFKKPEQEDFHKLYSSVEKYYLDAMQALYDRDSDTAFVLVAKGKRMLKLTRDFRRQNWNYEWVPELLEKLKNMVGETKSLMTYVCDLEK